jgi:hypothetical protein
VRAKRAARIKKKVADVGTSSVGKEAAAAPAWRTKRDAEEAATRKVEADAEKKAEAAKQRTAAEERKAEDAAAAASREAASRDAANQAKAEAAAAAAAATRVRLLARPPPCV